MAGYEKLYVIGGLGGYLGSDGVNPIYLQILVGSSSREWWEPHYFAADIAPLGKLGVIIPEGPDDPDRLLDACLAFFPEAFEGCPSLPAARKAFALSERLDFNTDGVPELWWRLREEAREPFEQLGVWEAELVELRRKRLGDGGRKDPAP